MSNPLFYTKAFSNMRLKNLLYIMLLLIFKANLNSQILSGYLHNWNDANAPFLQIQDVDSRYNFLNCSFAIPSAGTDYDMEFIPESQSPQEFRDQMELVQAQNKKVLISIGGATAPVQLNSSVEKDVFVASMTDILNFYQFDGLDIDLEGSSLSVSGGSIENPTDTPILLLIDAVKEIMQAYHISFGRKMLLTAAPETAFVQGGQSAYAGIWGAYLPVLNALRDSIDYMQVQLYNSGSMFGIDGNIYNQGTVDFIVSQTEALISGFSTAGGFFNGFDQEKVLVGLPACPLAAGGGYLSTDSVEAALKYLIGEGPQTGSYTLQNAQSYPGLGGMMTWSINWDASENCAGSYSYANVWQQIFETSTANLPGDSPKHLQAFPNPCSKNVQIKNARPNAPFQIMNLYGAIVKTGELNNQTIHIESLPNGMYLLTCENQLFRLIRADD
jgi:chitinase